MQGWAGGCEFEILMKYPARYTAPAIQESDVRIFWEGKSENDDYTDIGLSVDRS